MDTKGNTVFIFFSTARGPQLRWWFQWLSWFIRFVTRFPYGHVCIGDGQVVLDVTYCGDRFWPHIRFCLFYPTLSCAFALPLARPMRLDAHIIRSSNRIWPTFWRWWTFGAAQSDDCVCAIRNLLLDAGRAVPTYIVTPRQLFRWLVYTGETRYVRFSDSAGPNPLAAPTLGNVGS